MRHLLRDGRDAVRAFRATPGFALTAALTFALGVGATTAIFSVVYALLLRPLPYPAPDRLRFVDGVLARPEGPVDFQVQYRDVEAMRTTRAFRDTAAWSTGWGLTLEGTEGAARLQANFVGRGYFRVLGAAPALGRDFLPGEHALGGDAFVAILSDATWRQHFGGDPAILGRDVRLQGRPFTVVGVMPPGFHDVPVAQGELIEAWVPIERAETLFGFADPTRNPGRLFWAVARLPDGVTEAAAAAELAALSTTLAGELPDHRDFTLRAIPLDRSFFVDVRRPLWALLAASAFVVLVAAANVATLLLVRSQARTRELAMRLAIGASPAALVRRLLVESTLLALGGAVLGVGAAWWATPVLLRWSPLAVPAFVHVDMNGTVLLLALAATIASSVGAGLLPIWRATRLSVTEALAGTGGNRATSRGRAGHWVAGLEIAAAFVLAVGAWLMGQSVAALTRTDLAFDAERLLSVRLELPADRYTPLAARVRFADAVLARLRATPGVADAVVWGPSGLGRATWVSFLTPDDRRDGGDDARVVASRHSTNPGALASLGIALRRGRDFSTADRVDTLPVAIVSEALAARLWPGAEAVGRQFETGAAPNVTMVTVIGVAADARHRGRFRFSEGAMAHDAQLDVYFPYAQRPNGLVGFAVRATSDPAQLVPSVRAALTAVDPVLPVFDVTTLDERLRGEEASVRFAATLMNAFSVLAVGLAAVGVYGVLAAGVSGRRRELAIRAAVGASPWRLQRDVLGHGAAIVGAAISAGMLIVWALARVFASLLFGVDALNAWALAGGAGVLATAAGIATWLPARRAAAAEPVAVLRGE